MTTAANDKGNGIFYIGKPGQGPGLVYDTMADEFISRFNKEHQHLCISPDCVKCGNKGISCRGNHPDYVGWLAKHENKGGN